MHAILYIFSSRFTNNLCGLKIYLGKNITNKTKNNHYSSICFGVQETIVIKVLTYVSICFMKFKCNIHKTKEKFRKRKTIRNQNEKINVLISKICKVWFKA